MKTQLGRTVKEHAIRTPDAIAVKHPDREFSYAELDRFSDCLVSEFKASGVGSGDRVGVLLPRSFEMLAAIVACSKAGVVYVPLDEAYPAKRLAAIARTAGMKVLLTKSPESSLVVDGDFHTLSLDKVKRGQEPLAITLHDPRPTDPVYLLFTSGSTGEPKGVVVSNQALDNYLTWARSYYPLDGELTPLFTSIAFDLTVTSIFLPLLLGKTILPIPSTSAMQTVKILARLLKQESSRIMLLKMTPSFLECLNFYLGTDAVVYGPSSLILGGEALNFGTLQLWRSQARGCRIFNEYGPTEATVGCAIYEVTASDPSTPAPVSIGKPITNCSFHVLGENRDPVPPNQLGELYIEGKSLASGYYANPAETERRFIRYGEKTLYRTGDLVRQDSDGSYQYAGRIDSQVKLRGFRIELGEIENAIEKNAAVSRGKVIVCRDSQNEDYLAAFITLRAGAGLSQEDLQLCLRESLPAYMVPLKVLVLEKFPLSSNEKIDTSALRLLESAGKQRS